MSTKMSVGENVFVRMTRNPESGGKSDPSTIGFKGKKKKDEVDERRNMTEGKKHRHIKTIVPYLH